MSGVVVNPKEKKEMLDRAKEYFNRYSMVIEDIENGMCEASACRKHNVSVSTFRYVCRHDFSDKSSFKEDKDEEVFLTWQDRLYSEIFGVSVSAPEDFDKALDFVRSCLSKRESEILDLYYKEGLTFDEVGKKLDISKERVRQILYKVKLKISRGKFRNALYFGYSYIEELNKIDKEFEEKRKEELKAVVESYASSLDKVNILNGDFTKYDIINVAKELYESGEIKNSYNLDEINIGDLELPIRAYNCLKRSGIDTLGDLEEFSKNHYLCEIRNLGRKTFMKIYECVSFYGLNLIYEPDDANVNKTCTKKVYISK